MPTLHEVQSLFRGAMFGVEAPELLEAIAGDGLQPTARLQIYRHHVLTSLTEALKTIFPVVCRLVDVRFFAYAADAYIRQQPPVQPCLFEYGASFPAFLAAFPPCQGLPYLADVAQLEWALNAAYHAPEHVPVTVDTLRSIPAEQLGDVCLQIDPARHLLHSVWPVDAIWRANQDDQAQVPPTDLAAGGVCLEVLRCEDDVGFRRLEPALYAFRAALAAGQSLTAATEAALDVAEDFDCTLALCDLFSNGVVGGLMLPT